MRNKSLNIDILSDKLRALISLPNRNEEEILNLIKKEFINLSDKDIMKIYLLLDSTINNIETEKIEIVTTTPISFNLNTRKTYPVIEELIQSAKKHIVITGYSITEYIDDILQMLNNKGKQGVKIELYLNDYEQTKGRLDTIIHSNRNYFIVYKYTGKKDDEMSSLHAKTIVVDGYKMLISSANLSYHGMVGNIEVGVLIESQKKCQQVLNIYKELKSEKIFTTHK